jgi:hypothetical protein
MLQHPLQEGTMFRHFHSSPSFFVALSSVLFLTSALAQDTSTQNTSTQSTTQATTTQKTPNYVVRYFDLSQINLAPGEIVLSPDYQTIIEFEDLPVEMASSGRSDQITVEINGSIILLRANRDVVNTDLTVMVGGQMALFMLNTDPARQKVRRYVVFNK